VVGALVALTVLAGLAACSPADKKVTALHHVDGHPTVRIGPCADFGTKRISVYSVGASPEVQWTVRRDDGFAGSKVQRGAAAPAEVQLLQAPPGWVIVNESLTEFAPGAQYAVSVYGDGGSTVPIQFTVEELAALKPNQVLVGRYSSKREAITESKFRREAEKSC
jgi:hypothetical protein